MKGFLGAGEIIRGKQNDEDFPAAVSYSNTYSNAFGHFGYGNIDAGYTFLEDPGAKLGAFVGYNFYTEHVNSFNCYQIAADYTCSNADPFLGLVEDDRINSLRLGLSAQYMLTDRLKFSADVAYVPWASFKGQDDHNYREFLLGETSSRGDGVMLEATLDYYVSRNWYVGIGGRYRAWNLRTGSEVFNFLGGPQPLPEPAPSPPSATAPSSRPAITGAIRRLRPAGR